MCSLMPLSCPHFPEHPALDSGHGAADTRQESHRQLWAVERAGDLGEALVLRQCHLGQVTVTLPTPVRQEQ